MLSVKENAWLLLMDPDMRWGEVVWLSIYFYF